MPKLPLAWNAVEPDLVSRMDGLQVSTIGHIPAKREWVETRFPFTGLGLVLSGRGTFRHDEGPVQVLVAPAVFHIWPGPRFSYGPEAGTAWEERYVCFAGPRVSDWRRWGWLDRPTAPRTLRDPELHAARHQEIARAFHPEIGSEIDEAKLLIERLVHGLHRESREAGAVDELDALLRRWRTRGPGPGGLRAAARELGMSYSGLREKIRARTGLSAYQFQLRLRLDLACRELQSGRESVKAIAYATGFRSVQSFCRAFRRVRGQTPGEYRTRARVMG